VQCSAAVHYLLWPSSRAVWLHGAVTQALQVLYSEPSVLWYLRQRLETRPGAVPSGIRVQ
jgi:hypothetical protein